jgi:hypothetical protein
MSNAYRELEIDETIQPGDEFLTGEGKWKKAIVLGGTPASTTWNKNIGQYRRLQKTPDKKMSPVANQNPLPEVTVPLLTPANVANPISPLSPISLNFWNIF